MARIIAVLIAALLCACTASNPAEGLVQPFAGAGGAGGAGGEGGATEGSSPGSGGGAMGGGAFFPLPSGGTGGVAPMGGVDAGDAFVDSDAGAANDGDVLDAGIADGGVADASRFAQDAAHGSHGSSSECPRPAVAGDACTRVGDPGECVLASDCRDGVEDPHPECPLYVCVRLRVDAGTSIP